MVKEPCNIAEPACPGYSTLSTCHTSRMRFEDLLNLTEEGPNTFVGVGQAYPWGLYGGQLIAQALHAAAATVRSAHHVHSLHAYFLRAGDAAQQIRFEVDQLRDGRSYATRAVVARQLAGALLNATVSFQLNDEDASPDPQTKVAMPLEVPSPEDLTDDNWSSLFERRWTLRRAGQGQAWLRVPFAGTAESDGLTAACALAFLSDDLPDPTVRSRLAIGEDFTPGDGQRWQGISMDHAIWFHAPPEVGDWQLFDFRCEGPSMPRGLALGHVFARNGTLLATVTQEVLLRPIRGPRYEARPGPQGAISGQPLP